VVASDESAVDEVDVDDVNDALLGFLVEAGVDVAFPALLRAGPVLFAQPAPAAFTAAICWRGAPSRACRGARVTATTRGRASVRRRCARTSLYRMIGRIDAGGTFVGSATGGGRR
jgi:hypothetical protein